MIKVYSFIFILFLSTSICATNIAVIDINFLINNSEQFKEISKKINSAQIEIKEKFNNIEQDLLKIKLELEESKLILSNDEFNLQKEEYYKKVAKFEDDVTKFNNHYENEIIKIKNIIFAKISELMQDPMPDMVEYLRNLISSLFLHLCCSTWHQQSRHTRTKAILA